MQSSENPNRERMLKERRRLLAQIDRLSTGGPKHLDTEQRLHAALFIREQYESLIRPKGSFRVAELEDRLGEMAEGLSGIRIHRYMLRASERQVTTDLIDHYKDRPEPLKKTRTYFDLAAALARISGDDPVEAKIALLRRTSLDAIPITDHHGNGADEFNPTAGLLRLVRSFASDTAHRLDLVKLFGQVERLQAGWSPNDETSVFSMAETEQRYSRGTVFSGLWYMDQMPALPSVRIAEFPLAILEDAEALLGQPDGQETLVTGTFHTTWSVRLAIVPDGSLGVTPALLRTTRLQFTNASAAPLLPERTWEIRHENDGLDALHPDSGRQLSIATNPDLTIKFTKGTAARYVELNERDKIYQRTTPDEILPHEGLPCAEIEPLDAARMQMWFCHGAKREDHEIERAPFLEHAQTLNDGRLAEWFTTPCLARDLELSIRQGGLRLEFSRFVSSMRRAVDALEKERLAQMSEVDRELADKWAAERIMLDGDEDSV